MDLDGGVLMTLGRSTSGAIKIKTDGGLRAVECACCAPCFGAPNAVQKQTTESYYNMWKKGGQLTISGTLGDTAFSPPNTTPNGVCSWSFSETISIPANTCVASLSKTGPVSCSDDYYGYSLNPSVLIFLSVIKSSDGNYYSQVFAQLHCPFLLYLNQFLNMCTFSIYFNPNQNAVMPYTPGDSGPLQPFVFFGADFAIIQPSYAQGAAAQGQSVTPTTLNFQFTPNP